MTEPMVTAGSRWRRRPVLGCAVAVAVALGAVAVYLASNGGNGAASVESRCDSGDSIAPATPPDKPPTPVSAGRIGTVIGAAVAADTIVLNLSQDTEIPLRPARVLGVDPATFARRWEWRYPAGGGLVQANLTGRPADLEDPYLRVAGDVAMTVVGRWQADPTLVGLDTSTGRERWRVGFPTTSSPSVAYADPCIAVLSLRDTVDAGVGSLGLWAVDVRSGETIWRGAESVGLLCIDVAAPWLYAFEADRLTRIRLDTGKTQTADLAGAGEISPCASMAAAEDRFLDRSTGRWFTVDWTTNRAVSAGTTAEGGGERVDLIGDTLVVSHGRAATAHDGRTGDQLWRQAQSEIGQCAVLPGQRLDTVYCWARAPVTASESSLQLSAVDARSGQLRWRADAVRGVGGPVGVDTRTTAVFLAMENQIAAIDGRTGRLLWTVPSDPVRPVLAGPWLLVRANGETLAYRVH